MGADGSGEPGRAVPYLQVGEQVGAYRIESFVALGGMAFVYEATDTRLGRQVALKVLAPALAEESDFRERFVRESRFAASLDHPNIVPIYEAGELDGLLFIAMRFVQGVDLDAHLRKVGRLDLQRTLAILTPIGDALDAAHDAGLVHRDVKPANILLGSSGREGREHVYLTDFGITKRTSGLTKLTATGNMIGTMSYTSPEQIMGEKLDARTDLYSFGCVVYQCLTGVAPFVRDNQGALVWAHLNEHPAPMSSRRPGLAPVDAVVARALRKHPQDRHGRCEDFTDALREALRVVGDEAGHSTGVVPTLPRAEGPAETTVGSANSWTSSATSQSATSQSATGQEVPLSPGPAAGSVDPPRPPPPRLRVRSARRRRTIVIALAGVATVALCAAVLPLSGSGIESGTAQRMDQTSNEDATGSTTAEPVPPLTTAPEVATGDAVPSGDRSAATAISPVDPSAGTGPGSVTPTPAVAIPSVQGQPLAVGPTPGSVTIAPDGRLAYVANRGEGIVTVVDTNLDKVIGTIAVSAGPPRYVAFTPDGTRAYVSAYTDDMTVNRVAVLDTRTTRELGTVEVDGGPYALAVTPDQKYVYVPSHDAAKIDVIETGTDRVVDQIPVPNNPHSVTFTPDGMRAYVANHESNMVAVLDVASRRVVDTIPVCTSPHRVTISPDASRIAVACYDSNDVYFIDTATLNVVGRSRVGEGPQDVTYSPDGAYIYTANVVGNSVSVVDSVSGEVTATIPTQSPTSIAVRADGRRAYVTNLDAGTLTILNTAG
jgi:serine/threonine-protein kinase